MKLRIFDQLAVGEIWGALLRRTTAPKRRCRYRGDNIFRLPMDSSESSPIMKRTSLLLLGVPESRIETISFGKEKPHALCHEEHCWAENRPADFVDEWTAWERGASIA